MNPKRKEKVFTVQMPLTLSKDHSDVKINSSVWQTQKNPYPL